MFFFLYVHHRQSYHLLWNSFFLSSNGDICRHFLSSFIASGISTIFFRILMKQTVNIEEKKTSFSFFFLNIFFFFDIIPLLHTFPFSLPTRRSLYLVSSFIYRKECWNLAAQVNNEKTFYLDFMVSYKWTNELIFTCVSRWPLLEHRTGILFVLIHISLLDTMNEGVSLCLVRS